MIGCYAYAGGKGDQQLDRRIQQNIDVHAGNTKRSVVGYNKPHIYSRNGAWAIRQSYMGRAVGDLSEEFLAASSFTKGRSPFWKPRN